ncbi:hypothetical protein KS4_35500 [Poriferisphaera corsica]|uniref:Uncharacterized protein n=1 Tax=Poriferisphaera corsica TaxID=2528020 RepID=A0A517YZ25_9BACT|nr:hypothetical protein KS4_35500 [Poriferisphaera corsica]
MFSDVKKLSVEAGGGDVIVEVVGGWGKRGELSDFDDLMGDVVD